MSEEAMLEREAKRRGLTVTELKMLEAVPDNVIRADCAKRSGA